LFIAAYPDNKTVRSVVERMLDEFNDRVDLDEHRDELANSGIVGTEIQFPFFWFTLSQLVSRWPDQLHCWTAGWRC